MIRYDHILNLLATLHAMEGRTYLYEDSLDKLSYQIKAKSSEQTDPPSTMINSIYDMKRFGMLFPASYSPSIRFLADNLQCIPEDHFLIVNNFFNWMQYNYNLYPIFWGKLYTIKSDILVVKVFSCGASVPSVIQLTGETAKSLHISQVSTTLQ
ncbi:hypothetical protein GJ496_003590 [Pomphorhynchus laevis]|nr:hypothetical protein GJ496_003590 [Pomphorhynchus laevis]